MLPSTFVSSRCWAAAVAERGSRTPTHMIGVELTSAAKFLAYETTCSLTDASGSYESTQVRACSLRG